MTCELCGERYRNVNKHMDEAHEFEMAQRRKNEKDRVTALYLARQSPTTCDPAKIQEALRRLHGGTP